MVSQFLVLILRKLLIVENLSVTFCQMQTSRFKIPRRGDFLGDVGFVGDSTSTISELDKSYANPTGYRSERRPSGMAPTTTIETVTIVRPLKVIAFICGVIVMLLLVLSLASSEWLLAQGWRQGLFKHCVSPDAIHPLPFGWLSTEAGCFRVPFRTYIIACSIMFIFALLLDAFGTLLTGLGLWSQDSTRKYKYYKIALYVMTAALILVLMALVLYPICFGIEMRFGNRDLWEFGWAYGVGWGASIFLFGGIVLLLVDKESEEIYYKERTIIQDIPGSETMSATKE